MEHEEILQRGRARRKLATAPALARMVRQRAGLTQVEIAEILGVDASAVSRWESGARMPRPEALAQYAALLDRLDEEEAAP